MLFTIVIPYKDTNKKYTDNCIKSLDDQIFKDFEVLFIHQDSQHLEEILESYSFNYRTINMGLHTNPGISRNKGILEAQGEYILFLDADDFLHPNALIYAKQIIDQEQVNVFKLKVKKTIVDRKTTLKEKKQALYQHDTLDNLSHVLKKLNVNADENKVMQMLFEENVVSAHYHEIAKEKFFKKISYQFKSHGFVVQKNIC